ncbi:MAG: hypothetical protein V1891_04735 [bacterium]
MQIRKEENFSKYKYFAAMETKYKISLYEGSLTDIEYIKKFNKTVIEKAQNKWGDLIELTVSMDELRNIQRLMVKHYDGPEPWYTFGYSVDDHNMIVCAFGDDDGNNGKIFVFRKNEDKKTYEEILKYGASKGIPAEEMDFLPLI